MLAATQALTTQPVNEAVWLVRILFTVRILFKGFGYVSTMLCIAMRPIDLVRSFTSRLPATDYPQMDLMPLHILVDLK